MECPCCARVNGATFSSAWPWAMVPAQRSPHPRRAFPKLLMTNPILRQTGIEDTALVDALLEASYATLLRRWYDAALLEQALPIIVRARQELLTSGTYFLIEEHGVALSAGGWTLSAPGPSQHSDAELGHIRHFATHPDHVGRGHAGRIMKRVISDCEALGVKQLDCQSTLAAEKFYQSQGFESKGSIDVPLPGGIMFPAIRMERRR